MDAISDNAICRSPNSLPAWEAIKSGRTSAPRSWRRRCSPYASGKNSRSCMPVHGLMVLSGPPAPARPPRAGLANQVAHALSPTKAHPAGRPACDRQLVPRQEPEGSQQALVQTIPEFARGGPAIVLLDEVETLAGAASA